MNLNLCDVDLQVKSMEPEIGHINFSEMKLVDKGENHKVYETTTFAGYPIKIFLQGNRVANVIID